MLLGALFMATVFLESSRAATAPSSLVGRQFTLIEVNPTNAATTLSTIRFLANNRYASSAETNEGFFTATRATTDSWRVATTKFDGSETIQYTIVFTSAESGTFTKVKAGERATGSFSQASVPAGGLATLTLQNETGPTGKSRYTIFFDAATGTFNIPKPGFGSGNFSFTPGATNSARLVLTYTGELAGDVDDLALQFRAASGSTIPSQHSGTQLIRGQVYSIDGTFTYTSVGQ
jgi:hypothetical protein